MQVNKNNVLDAIEQHRELLEYVLDEVLIKLQNLRPQIYPSAVFIDHVNFGVDEVTLTYYDGQNDTQMFIPNAYLTLSDKELEARIENEIAQYNKEVEHQRAIMERQKAKFEPKES